MDITVLLRLDTSGFDAAAKEASASLRGTEEAARGTGRAAGEAADGLRGAAAVAGMLPGPLGQIAGRAAAAERAMRSMGASAKGALAGGLAGGLAASVALLASEFKKARDAQEDFAASNALANAAAAAESAARAYSRLREEIAGAAAEQRGMADAASEARRVAEATALAELERERNEAIAANPADRDSIDADFDARRRALESRSRRAADADSGAAMRSRLDEVRRLAAEAGRSMEAALDSAAGHSRRALGWSAKSNDAWFAPDKERYAGYATEESEAGKRETERAQSLKSEIGRLEAEARTLEARLAAQSGNAALRDAEDAAAEAKAKADAAVRGAAGAGGAAAAAGAAREAAGTLGGSDSLARIGGSLGADYAAQNKANMQYQEARRARELLEKIERKIGGGGAVFA